MRSPLHTKYGVAGVGADGGGNRRGDEHSPEAQERTVTGRVSFAPGGQFRAGSPEEYGDELD